MYPVWVYFAVALAIAVAAFVLAQFLPGMGVPFVILTTTLWVTFAAHRGRMAGKQG